MSDILALMVSLPLLYVRLESLAFPLMNVGFCFLDISLKQLFVALSFYVHNPHCVLDGFQVEVKGHFVHDGHLRSAHLHAFIEQVVGEHSP